jgi:hypothetical protein
VLKYSFLECDKPALFPAHDAFLPCRNREIYINEILAMQPEEKTKVDNRYLTPEYGLRIDLV